MDQLNTILSNQSLSLLILIWSLVIWSLVWKGLALWRAARRQDKLWYVILLILNTAGIAEIIYLIVTRDKNKSNKVIEQ